MKPLLDGTRPHARQPVRLLQRTGADFRVRMADDWVCPHCLRPLRPSAVTRDADAINIICERCHQDVLRVELSIAEPAP
jgi:hypothetical protein